LVALETMESLKAKSIRKVEITFKRPEDLARFRTVDPDLEIHSETRVTLRYQGSPSPLIDALAGVALDDLTISPPSLEDLFLHHLGLGETSGTQGGGA